MGKKALNGWANQSAYLIQLKVDFNLKIYPSNLSRIQQRKAREKYNTELCCMNNNRIKMSDIYLIEVPKGEIKENGMKQYLRDNEII